MALGRAEALFEKTGKKVAICDEYGYPRDHAAWHGHPAIDRRSSQKIVDCPPARPYILGFKDRKMIYNENHVARAGRVHLTPEERASNKLVEPYAVVGPIIKQKASPNKSWGIKRWEAVIKDFPIPVYQLCETPYTKVIRGARRYDTPSFRHALAVIERATLVMCNEGGNHHMAASMGVPAVVIFGAFISPAVTGYDFHVNITARTKEGFCGSWDSCEHCKVAMASITPSMVKRKALRLLDSIYEQQQQQNKSLHRI